MSHARHSTQATGNRAPACPVEIVQISPPQYRYKKVRFQYLDGPEAGLVDDWKPHARLLTLWEGVEAWLEATTPEPPAPSRPPRSRYS
jgi:hypothetical protein